MAGGSSAGLCVPPWVGSPARIAEERNQVRDPGGVENGGSGSSAVSIAVARIRRALAHSVRWRLKLGVVEPGFRPSSVAGRVWRNAQKSGGDSARRAAAAAAWCVVVSMRPNLWAAESHGVREIPRSR
jgi:hypothetical protein